MKVARADPTVKNAEVHKGEDEAVEENVEEPVEDPDSGLVKEVSTFPTFISRSR